MREIVIAVWLLLGSGQPIGQAQINAQMRNSTLTLSGFECSVVAPDAAETERLFNLALNAGRDFIAFARSHPEQFAKSLQSNVAMLWSQVSGPTPDFILGQIYANRVEEVYKEHSSDKRVWDLTRQRIYREKNCALIGR